MQFALIDPQKQVLAFPFLLRNPRGKAEKYPLRDVSLHGCRVKHCSMRLFMAALP